MPDPSSDRDPVEALAAEFAERIRRGERPAVEEYATKHPALAKKINELFPTIAQMEQLKCRKEHSSATAVALGGPRPENLGDFRILREVGRGGMGIVYEAEQKSLGRRVAVKVLPQSSLLNARQLQRFHREAQSAAGLHHTNVVPVFGAGEEGGYHYIVMQMIPGVGLDEILLQLAESRRAESPETDPLATASGSSPAERIAEVADAGRMLVCSDIEHATGPGSSVCPGIGSQDAAAAPNTLLPKAPTEDFGVKEAPTVTVSPDPASRCQGLPTGRSDLLRIGPTYWRNVARIGVQVADALSYAHERSVLHRDIKPSNLIFDRQGIVWVTDFGLAKAMQDDSVSRTGDIVGTLRYMAPERLHGKADVRSDIYSLGLTLYETLALRPAYEASDTSSLLRKISEESPPRLATAAAGVPRDLETIVMKTIAREPAHRYLSAGELAGDLRLFLEDRPIRARRVSPVERLWRWCRRNRAVAGLAATALALLVLVAVVASVGYARTRIANTKVNAALAGESRQRQKAEATTQLALEALDDIFKQFAPERMSEFTELALDDSSDSEIQIPVQPVLSKEAASLLEHLLVFYHRLAVQGGDDAVLRRKTADANRRVGDIRVRLGQFEQAEAAYLRSIESYRQIEESTPADIGVATEADVRVATEIARIYNNLGDLQVAAGSPEASRSFHVDALKTLDRLATASDPLPAVRYEMARTCYFLGRGAPPEMAHGARRPGPHPPRGGPPPPDRNQRENEPHPPRGGPPLGPPRDGPGPPPPDRNQRENEQYLLRAIRLLEELAGQQPAIPDYRHLLARCYRDLPPAKPFGPDAARVGQTDRAIEILEKLVEDLPSVPGYQHDLAKSYLHAFSQLPPGSHATGESRLRKALGIAEKLVAEHPNVPDYAASQAHVHFVLSEMLRHDRRPDEAELGLRKALSLQSSLVSRHPDVIPYQAWQATIQDALAMLLRGQGQMKEACSLLEAATAKLRGILETEPEAHYIERLLSRSYDNLADMYRQLGQEDLADEAIRQAEQHRDDRRPPPRFPHD